MGRNVGIWLGWLLVVAEVVAVVLAVAHFVLHWEAHLPQVAAVAGVVVALALTVAFTLGPASRGLAGGLGRPDSAVRRNLTGAEQLELANGARQTMMQAMARCVRR